MSVYITDESARAYWDSAKVLGGQVVRTHMAALRGAVTQPGGLKACSVPRASIVDGKLHVLVASRGARRHSKHVVPHVHLGALPPGSFRKLSSTTLIASPEFLFVRMARKLPLAATIRLGFELCGTYVANSAAQVPGDREPLTSIRKIERYLDRAGDIRGAAKARKALGFVVEQSNSPMETVLTMLLCMPCRYGGFGLPKPLMNQSIKLSGSQAAAAGRHEFRCDLYWPDSAYALEYYGRDWHTGVAQVAYDARRQSELQYRGVEVSVVTYEQIESPAQVALLAKKTAKRLGVRIRPPNARCLQARDELHRYLVGRRIGLPYN